MTNYQELHDKKLQEMKEKLLGSTITDKLELKNISNNNLEEVISNIDAILAPRQTWNNTKFRTGRIMGILKSIADNYLLRKQLLEVTGLSSTHIDLYFEVCGNLPYIEKGTDIINMGRPMKVNECKELITLVGLKLGIVIEESDLADITQERWDKLYENELNKIKETIEHNKKHKNEIPQEYEE